MLQYYRDMMEILERYIWHHIQEHNFATRHVHVHF